MAWPTWIQLRKQQPPRSPFHTGTWHKPGGYTGTRPVSEFRPPYEWTQKP